MVGKLLKPKFILFSFAFICKLCCLYLLYYSDGNSNDNAQKDREARGLMALDDCVYQSSQTQANLQRYFSITYLSLYGLIMIYITYKGVKTKLDDLIRNSSYNIFLFFKCLLLFLLRNQANTRCLHTHAHTLT